MGVSYVQWWKLKRGIGGCGEVTKREYLISSVDFDELLRFQRGPVSSKHNIGHNNVQCRHSKAAFVLKEECGELYVMTLERRESLWWSAVCDTYGSENCKLFVLLIVCT